MTLFSRPDPFSSFTTVELWSDAHISAQMLIQHLDPHAPLASRAHDFIDRSTEWLTGILSLGPGSRVLDLGCGPGLYANRLARQGVQVLGIDVSERSIDHARHSAERERLPATFRVGDYLTANLGEDHDAALLIYEDYSALSPDRRAALLRRVRAVLHPEGRIVFDVTAAARFDSFTEGKIAEPNLMGGFWSPEPYEGVCETWTYPGLLLALEKYTITTASEQRQFWNWTHCLTPADVTAELKAAGFSTPEMFGDTAGTPYNAASPTFAVCAQRE